MKRIASNILLTSVATIFAFLSVTYVSCTKAPTLDPTSCENHVCQNGGYCKSGACVCAVGYSDASCATAYNAKYAGGWAVSETIKGSNTPTSIGLKKSYNVSIVASVTPTSFLMNGLTGSSKFIDMVCDIDSSNSYSFYIDPYTPTGNGNYHIIYGIGSINSAANSIAATYYVNSRDNIGHIEEDTVVVTMNKF